MEISGNSSQSESDESMSSMLEKSANRQQLKVIFCLSLSFTGVADDSTDLTDRQPT